jgi:UPF0755 protein
MLSFIKRKKLLLLAIFLLGVLAVLIWPLIAVDSKEKEKFVISVDPVRKVIYETESLEDDSIENPLASHSVEFALDNLSAVNNAINPKFKYVNVPQGLRKEQVAERFASALGWSEEEKAKFIDFSTKKLEDFEGYYHPGTYTVYRGENSLSVITRMISKFNDQVMDRFDPKKAGVLKLETVLKIASLIERETNGSDKRLIAGIIWNRIWTDMSLDIDATLQYAKGNEKNGWWPVVVPKDKYIDSPYNTYQNKGLPPTPISNPGVASIAAVLNPIKTPCLFYFHDKKGKIHCSVTYKEHKRLVGVYY